MTVRKARKDAIKLRIPHVWNEHVWPTLVDVYFCKSWLWTQICALEDHNRTRRIAVRKDKIACSSKGTFSYVFEHLKNKVLEEPANLVTSEDGHIVYQPIDALSNINTQWDTIFSANMLQSGPMKIVEIIWPYIKNDFVDFVLPDMDADALYTVVQNRKTFAAPGLDGWRTTELQALPKVCFIPIANFFKRLEISKDDFPKALLCAKQMILNKNGRSEPLQKRLITVLPALLLSYTGARYQHLQSWQNACMPKQIIGGIKHRQMTHIATDLRLQIDKANLEETALIGIKLDKSKCFDLIVPNYIAALFLSFGMDKKIVNFFLGMYKGLHRHLFYKSWAAPQPTTAANGVAQGCSLSLVAMNLYSMVWVCLLRHLPEVTVRAFVDDAYLWTHVINVHILEKALAVTELWDAMVGQRLNPEKSVIWGTTADSRKIVKRSFPSMKLKHEMDVLGTVIHTSNRLRYAFPEEKTTKIIADTRNIAALPLPRTDKIKLLGMKVIPQCSFASGISNIPKHTVGKIQSEIVSVLWQRRPPWRARWLVLAFLGKPHRIEPCLARAYCAIMEFLRFFHANKDYKPLIIDLLNASFDSKYGLIPKLKLACETFGVTLHSDLTLSWRNGDKIPVEELTAKDARKTFQMLAINVTYQKCADTKRKDLFKPQGVVDKDLTMLFHSKSAIKVSTPFPASSLFENQLVGAAPTKDRLFAAKLADDANCRFCLKTKESMNHLVECQVVCDKIGHVPSHELGPNFALLGIVEHPCKIAEHRLRYVPLQTQSHETFDENHVRMRFYTDGSVVWNNFYWLESGGYSIVNDQGELVSSGAVTHWHISSYTTELFAFLQVILQNPCPIHVFMDCQTVTKQFQQMVQTLAVDPQWSHQRWWQMILECLQIRRQKMRDPIVLEWIPAHVCENIPVHMIPQDVLIAKNTTRQHILLNRLADRHARHAAVQHSAIHPDDQHMLFNAVLAKQNWLTRLADLIYCDYHELQQEAKCDSKEDSEQKSSLNEAESRQKFPNLYWDMNSAAYRWKVALPVNVRQPNKKQISPSDWEAVQSFCNGLVWKVDGGVSISFVELALIFHIRGFRFSGWQLETKTFRELTSALRKVLMYMKTNAEDVFLPGSWQRSLNRSYGKALPAGAITGATPWLSNQELVIFANLLNNGAGKNLSTWTWFLDDDGFTS